MFCPRNEKRTVIGILFIPHINDLAYIYYLEPLNGFHLQLTPEVKNWDQTAGKEYMKNLFKISVKLDDNKNIISKEEFLTSEDLRLKYPPKTENSRYFRYLNKVLLLKPSVATRIFKFFK